MTEAFSARSASPEITGFVGLEQIGKGGSSTVYRARQPDFDRQVAVKVLNERLDDEGAVAAFEHECRVMGSLWDHPNIVTVFASAFTADGRPCIVMQLFQRGSYQQLLRRPGSVKAAEAVRLGIHMSGALATAHGAGIVHGDVKPQNIFQSSYDEPVLGDFGIAALVGAAGVGEVPRGFSVHYAAPEAIRGEAAPSADQYSLAATIFTMLAGRRPFETGESEPTGTPGDTRLNVLKQVLHGPTPRLPRRFGRPLVDVVHRAMSRDPHARFAGMAQFGAALCEVEQQMGLPHTKLQIARPPRFDAGLLRLSDGRAEVLDDDLAIGRNPEREPLAPGQRAVVLGAEDRTVSRRHIELRREQGAVTAVCSGQFTRLVRNGKSTRIPAGSSVHLRPGDAVRFGETSWIRYEAGDALSPEPTGAAVAPAVIRRDQRKPAARNSLEAPPAEDDSDIRDSTTGTLPPVELGPPDQAREEAEAPSEHSGVEARVCSRCDNSNRSEATVCVGTPGCGEELSGDDSSLRQVAQPVPGSIRFSDGTAASIDADLMVGRNPFREPLEEGMRGVVHGLDDVAVSRRQFELRRDGWAVFVVSRGGRTILDRAGRLFDIGSGTRVELRTGDVLRYGNGAWCRYDAVSAEPRSDSRRGCD